MEYIKYGFQGEGFQAARNKSYFCPVPFCFKGKKQNKPLKKQKHSKIELCCDCSDLQWRNQKCSPPPKKISRNLQISRKTWAYWKNVKNALIQVIMDVEFWFNLSKGATFMTVLWFPFVLAGKPLACAFNWWPPPWSGYDAWPGSNSGGICSVGMTWWVFYCFWTYEGQS